MLDNKTIGERLRKLRKSSGMSQTELAQILDCDQASVSRLESGIQGTSSLQLIQLAETFKVDLNSIVSGQIDYWETSRLFERKPKLKKRYQSHLETNGRELLPLFHLVDEKKGVGFTNKILKDLLLEDLRSIPPHTKVSVRCLIDFLQAVKDQGVDLSKEVKTWVTHYNNVENFGHLLEAFKNCKDPLDVIQLSLINNDQIDSVFELRLEERKSHYVIISLKKRAYLQGVDLEHTELAPIFTGLVKTFHEFFPEMITGRPLKGTFIKELKKNLTGEGLLRLEIL